MSTPPPAAGPHDGERRKSLGKYVKRMSSVFKRDRSTKGATEARGAVVAPALPVIDQHQDARDDAATRDGAQEQPAKAASIKQEEAIETPAAAAAAAAAAA